MSFFEVLMNILAIIGIIAVGGLLIFVLGDFMLSILDNKKKNENISSYNKENVREQTFSSELTKEKTEIKKDENKFIIENEEVKPVDFDKALEEEGSNAFYNETKENAFESVSSTDSIEAFSSEDTSVIKELEQEQPKKTVDINEMLEDDSFDFGDDFDFDNIFDDEKKEEIATAVKNANSKTEIKALEEEKALNSELESLSEETVSDALVSEKTFEEIKADAENQIVKLYNGDADVEAELKEEIESLKAELREQKEEYERLARQSKETEEKLLEEKTNLQTIYVEPEEKTKANLSLAEYEARLEILQARLKENEKDLKQIKKEFIPLRKVRKNLDKDIKKLRRREALVAKQKVVLYGVNNIADIDPEKAKKLAEDLDLLDGLKVSVRHCEEVMEENKDRYPILETSYRIISTTNKEIKEDIAECERAIRILKGEEDGDIVSEKVEVVQTQKVNNNENAQIEEIANPEILIGNASDIVNNPYETSEKRGRGRPRKVLTEEEIAALAEPKEKRGRGRPKKILTEEEIAALAEPKEKRGRGRPRKEEVSVLAGVGLAEATSHLVDTPLDEYTNEIDKNFSDNIEKLANGEENNKLSDKSDNFAEDISNFDNFDTNNYDDLEPSLEDLLAIEAEERNNKNGDDDLF